MKSTEPNPGMILCRPRSVPVGLQTQAAQVAIDISPDRNQRPDVPLLTKVEPDLLAASSRRYWGKKGIHLTVGFLDNPPAALRARILQHMNAWSKAASVQFVETSTDPQVRIARVDSPKEDAGYWSYLGTEILVIPKDQPTMNLEGFTMNTPESEFIRVVRHETGHTLGFPHEHMRKELVERLDRKKVIAFYMSDQGWSKKEVIDQVLTPLEESSLLGSSHADSDSIMCYQIPGSLTLDGKPIPGGEDISEEDYRIIASLYPKLAPTP